MKRPPVVKEPKMIIFNHEISADCFEIHDAWCCWQPPHCVVSDLPGHSLPSKIGLNEALGRSADNLDGHRLRSIPLTTTAGRRDRSRSPHQEASNVLVPPEESDDSELRRGRQLDAFWLNESSMFFLGDTFPRRNDKLEQGERSTAMSRNKSG